MLAAVWLSGERSNLTPTTTRLRLGDEDPIIFSNLTRNADEPKYWNEYAEHLKSNDSLGEYESMGIWDLAIALDHLSLAAVGEGLGTCWIGITDEREIRKILTIPDEVQARMIMTLGYPDQSPEPRSLNTGR